MTTQDDAASSPGASGETRTWTVPSKLAGQRLDLALRELEPSLSRARIKVAIAKGAVKVNGRHVAKGGTVSEGDEVSLVVGVAADPEAPAIPEPDAPLVVLAESEDWVIVDKPAGQASAPLRNGETGALANAIAGHYPETQGVGYSPREPGLLHRLDTQTSGVLLVARSKETYDELADALKAGDIEKKYLLLCKEGDLADEGTIEIPIANHPKDSRRVYPCIHPRDVMRNSPRPALTEYVVKERKNGIALVEVSISRAIRHQIRAHFSAIGSPLLGDVLYGGAPIEGLARHALHASFIGYQKKAVEPFAVSSELPPDLRALID